MAQVIRKNTPKRVTLTITFAPKQDVQIRFSNYSVTVAGWPGSTNDAGVNALMHAAFMLNGANIDQVEHLAREADSAGDLARRLLAAQ